MFFFNENYINLIYLLLTSYKIIGDPSNDIDYLILCNEEFKNTIQEIFNILNINGKIWCLDLKTIFDACCSRLKIFDFPSINLYNKILYLDCDILVTNSLNKILDIPLENKIYALKEKCHRVYHCQLFNDEEYNLLDKSSTFSSGILLFNNNIIIKDLFSKVLLHINEILVKNNYELVFQQHKNVNFDTIFGDQPFIVYHAVKNNLYDNKKLINIVVNNPNSFNSETISHFPGGPGHYESKIVKMTNYMNNVMFNMNKNDNKENDTLLLNKKYKWNNSNIEFLENGEMNAFGPGKYEFINKYLVKCYFGHREHLLKFNDDYSTFISVRKGDFNIVRNDL